VICVDITIEEFSSFCKKKGFVYQNSEIYGGMSGFWDFGHLGTELYNNIKQAWWKHFVHDKEMMVGIDASIISHPKVWKASGHLDSFGDLLISCTKCKKKFRADHLIEDKIGVNVEGKEIAEINQIIKDNDISCPECESLLAELKNFNLLFETKVGADEDKKNVAYLRGETAQGMFTSFKQVLDSTRQQLPFGIAQIGKCFRNEISPRDFIFRCREFTIGEFEFFIHPEDVKCPLLTEKHLNLEFNFLDAENQEAEKNDLKKETMKGLLEKNKLDEWHAYWLSEQYIWFAKLGFDMNNFKIREHTKVELSHYSSATFDFDYSFPFGSKEVAGNANRGQYDLTQHINESGEKLDYYDEESKSKVIPRVIEPTFGMDRIFLAAIVDAFTQRKDEKGKDVVVLKLHPKIAPIKIAVYPLVNKLYDESRKVFESLQESFVCKFDKAGSIGRRYARADEEGVPYSVTIDFDTPEKQVVTIRDRDSGEQMMNVPLSDLKSTLRKLLDGDMKFIPTQE
jgi:glycyl-tRNA synthetase